MKIYVVFTSILLCGSLAEASYINIVEYLKSFAQEEPGYCQAAWAKDNPEILTDLAKIYLEAGKGGKALTCLEMPAVKNEKKGQELLKHIRSTLEEAIARFKTINPRKYNLEQLVDILLAAFSLPASDSEESCNRNISSQEANSLGTIYEKQGFAHLAAMCFFKAQLAARREVRNKIIEEKNNVNESYEELSKRLNQAEAEVETPYKSKYELLNTKINDAKNFILEQLGAQQKEEPIKETIFSDEQKNIVS